jgi:type I restriction enzyme, S subunit
VSEWEIVPLDRLVEPGRGISYGIVQPGGQVADGVPIVRVSDIRNGRIATDAPLRVSPAIEASHARTRLKGGELLLTLVGTVGEVAVVPDSLAGWNTARAIAVIPVREEIGAYWIRVALETPVLRELINTRLNTTVQATLNLRDVAQLPIVLPPPKERQAISYILGALDDKIELNRQMNETLETISRALFKSWFVDFDPARAKSEGREVNLQKSLAVLFPNSFEDSELGDIPKGWKVNSLESVSSVEMGLSPDSESYNVNGIGVPLINGPVEFGEYFPIKSKWTTSPTRMARKGDLIFCVRGSTTGRRVVADDPYCLGRGVCALRSKVGARTFLYQLINSELNRLLSKTTGSVFPSLSAPDIKGFLVIAPHSELVRAFEHTVSPLTEQIELNITASRTLVALRDALLPKLISGEIRIEDAGRFVGGT